MQTLLILFFLGFVRPAAAAVDWNALLDSQGGSAVQFGAELSGLEPFRRRPDTLFAPASTSKLFTAALALETLGAGYRYPTLLRFSRTSPDTVTSLELIGSGDPSWGVPELGETIRTRVDQIAEALKTRGVTTILGEPRATAIDPRWNALTIPEGWKDSDTSSCGGALAQAFNFGLNCGTLRVSSPTKAAWLQSGLDFPVTLSISNGSRTSLGARLVRNAVTGAPYFLVEGTWKSGTASLTLPIYDTRSWARILFRQALVEKGIRIVAAPRGIRGTPEELKFFSPPLSELLKPFLKNSVNFLGDAILKTVGARQNGPSLLGAGLAELSRYLQSASGSRDFKLNDGSGLSRTSRASPAMMQAFLSRLPARDYFSAIWAALPVAGVDGTLKNRMKGSPAQGVLRAKTGTLDGVYNLAGFVPHGSSFVPFVLFTSTDSAHSSVARAAEDRVGIRLTQLHSSPFVDAVDFSEAPYPYYPEHAGFDAQ